MGGHSWHRLFSVLYLKTLKIGLLRVSDDRYDLQNYMQNPPPLSRLRTGSTLLGREGLRRSYLHIEQTVSHNLILDLLQVNVLSNLKIDKIDPQTDYLNYPMIKTIFH